MLVDSGDAPRGHYANLALTPNGHATVAWLESSTDDFDLDEIWVNRSTTTAGFGTPERVESGFEVDEGPWLVESSEGDITLLVLAPNGSASGIWGKWYEAGYGWHDSELVSFDEPTATSLPQVVLDGDGDPVVVWSQEIDGHGALWLRRHDALLGWTAPVRIDATDLGPVTFGMALDFDGSILIAWSESDGVESTLWTRRHTSSTLGAASVIKAGERSNIWGVVPAFNNYGEGVIVWWTVTDVREAAWASAYRRPCGWSAPVRLGSADLAASQHLYVPTVTISDSGRGLAVWYATTAGNSALDVWAAEYDAVSGWQLGTAVTSDVHNVLAPQLAMDDDGNALVSWMQQDTSNWDIYRVWSVRSTAEGEWDEPVLMSAPDDTRVWSPHGAFAANGEALLAWFSSNPREGKSVWTRKLE